MSELHDADAVVQRNFETTLLDRLRQDGWIQQSWVDIASDLNLPLSLHNAKPDAVWKTPTGQIVIVECYIHSGEAKAGHIGKLAKDVLKLAAIKVATPAEKNVKFIILLPEQSSLLRNNGWLTNAVALFADVERIPLTEDEMLLLRDANLRQANGNQIRAGSL